MSVEVSNKLSIDKRTIRSLTDGETDVVGGGTGPILLLTVTIGAIIVTGVQLEMNLAN